MFHSIDPHVHTHVLDDTFFVEYVQLDISTLFMLDHYVLCAICQAHQHLEAFFSFSSDLVCRIYVHIKIKLL